MSLEPKPCRVPTVILGEDKTLDVKIKSSVSGDPLDLTAASEIVAIFQNADNTYLERKLSTSGIILISGPGGHFQIVLTAAQTALLMPSASPAYSDIEVQITLAAKKSIVILKNAVNLVPRRFPSAP